VCALLSLGSFFWPRLATASLAMETSALDHDFQIVWQLSLP